MKRLKRLQQDHVNQIVSLSAVDDGWGDILWCAPLSGSSPDCGLTVSDPLLDDLVGVESHPHFVSFYETEAFLVDCVLDFLAVGVASRRAVIVFATETHRSMFDHALRDAGIDISEALRAGRFVVLDASKQLARFMVDGMPDPARFRATIGQLVFQAVHTGRDVRIYGEMVRCCGTRASHCRHRVRRPLERPRHQLPVLTILLLSGARLRRKGKHTGMPDDLRATLESDTPGSGNLTNSFASSHSYRRRRSPGDSR
jgi:DcmR-like sensory protein